ncbi:MAG: hypothetical protein DWI48_04655 [Chloroflexi bacterium]|nr:MAG: hypothetical protein DWI48_04655 [Chloroflexota bacterium]
MAGSYNEAMPDPDFGVDIEEMGHVFDEADVVIVRFHVIGQRLLLDMRPGGTGDLPLIRLVPPVNGAEERYRYLQAERPRMPLPDHITVVAWPRYVQVMQDTGLWQCIVDRLVREAGDTMLPYAEEAYRDVRAAERAEVAAAIRGGEGYESLWERAASR